MRYIIIYDVAANINSCVGQHFYQSTVIVHTNM